MHVFKPAGPEYCIVVDVLGFMVWVYIKWSI